MCSSSSAIGYRAAFLFGGTCDKVLTVYDSCLEISRKLLKNVTMISWRWYCLLLKPPSEAARH